MISVLATSVMIGGFCCLLWLCRDWTLVQILEWITWLPWIIQAKYYQRKHIKKINNWNTQGKSYHYSGIVPTPTEIQCETHNDGFSAIQLRFWGADKNGSLLYLQVVRTRRVMQSFILFRTPTGIEYYIKEEMEFPEVPGSSWRIGGLLLECNEPMRSWRISFNGHMKSSSEELVHMKINLIWRNFKAPVDFLSVMSANTLARNLYRNGHGHNEIRCLYEDSYDQWGALHGEWCVGGENPEIVYLRGSRSVRKSKTAESVSNIVKSTASVLIYGKGGNLIGFHQHDLQSGKKLENGYIQTANGYLHEVLSRTENRSYHFPSAQNFSFITNGTIYSLDNLTESPLTTGTADVLDRPCFFFNNSESEWSLVIKSSQSNLFESMPDDPDDRQTELMESSPRIVSLTDEKCRQSSLTGGKGSSLAMLMSISSDTKTFSVPDGIVITTLAWNDHVSSNNEIYDCIDAIQISVKSPNDMIKACNKCVEVIEKSELSVALRQQVDKHLKTVFGENLEDTRFAVRSSACGEDSSEASSAGQNETILGCRLTLQGRELLFQALLKCWASQFSFRSVEYRRQRGQPLDNGMAVVIQEMVKATEAGVAFTQDPATGNPGKMLITANYGLGETVVSANAEPDSIYVIRKNDYLEIGSTHIGGKKLKCMMQEEGTTQDVPVDPTKSSQLCLSTEKTLRLAEITVQIEKKFCSARDLEFAFQGEKLFMLQARPITSQHNWTEYELTREFDGALLTDLERSTIANTGEVFPDCITPLTLSMVPKMIDLALQKDFTYREWPVYEFDPSAIRTMNFAMNRCMVNMGEMLYRGMSGKITMVNKAIDLAVFGELVTNSEIHEWALKRYGIMTKFADILRSFCGFSDIILNLFRIKTCTRIYRNYHIILESSTASGIYNEICQRFPEVIQIFQYHSRTSSGSTMAQCIALVILAEDSGDVSPVMIQNIAALFSCISDTESGSVPTDLENLSNALLSSSEVEQFLSRTPHEAQIWLESNEDEPGRLYREFMERHGHRTIKEFEIRCPSWSSNPEGLIKSIQQLTKASRAIQTTKTKKSLDQTLEELVGDIKQSNKRALRFVLKVCGSAVKLRETTKSLSIKTLDAFKKAYWQLGECMVREFRLPDSDLVFFLSQYEIGVLLDNRQASLVLKAIQRRRLLSSLQKIELPEISVGVVEPVSTVVPQDSMSSNEKMHGTPVCFGRAQGTAKVITKLEEASNIERGDILVTHCTDVGWTPYFPLLGGVVTEIGGLISHGAVVAREYGLPCVVGMKGATQKFKSGDTVLIDAKEGFLQKL